MTIPNILLEVLEGIPETSQFKLLGGWTARTEGQWSFRFLIRHTRKPTEYMPKETEWHLVAKPQRTGFNIRIYPDKDSGIVATFAHQDFNAPNSTEDPWRLGKPCLNRPASIFKRGSWADEPEEVGELIEWMIFRLLTWVDAAAEGCLISVGDPLELPVPSRLDGTLVLGFREEIVDFAWWGAKSETWGFARISPVRGAREAFAIVDFLDACADKFRVVRWGEGIGIGEGNGEVNAIWCRAPSIPVLEPWQAPATWSELSNWAAGAGFDLPGIIVAAGRKARRVNWLQQKYIRHLLIGFPLAETLGAEPIRMHWLAVSGLQLCERTRIANGARSVPEDRQAKDRQFATAEAPLSWTPTANWAPDQLRKRGEAEEIVRSKSILIIGAGTLGAAVAENLLRMGATRLGIVDNDHMMMGNLSRHSLTMSDLGHKKALALSRRLNASMPDAEVRPFTCSFPPMSSSDSSAMAEYDVIVDCTASDTVIDALAIFPWPTEKLFISLAMTWEAEGLLAYAASETSFPAVDAMSYFASSSPRLSSTHEMNMEGIGCWHPVFPATADDVQLWGAISSKFVRAAIESPKRTRAYFRQNADGTVTLNAI